MSTDINDLLINITLDRAGRPEWRPAKAKAEDEAEAEAEAEANAN